jgi:GDP/UDP-N,N'-diacetylbacillosamine 2-epimerase (hydrolysing)
MAESVISCGSDENSIKEAMEKAVSDEFRQTAASAHSLFGDGNTSERIVNTIVEYLNSAGRTNKKAFYDLKTPVKQGD